MHDKGNEENVFDRSDYQIHPADSLHLNLGFTRSWFQTPNSFRCSENGDAMVTGSWSNNGGLDPNGKRVGPTDQRSQIRTFNIAPTWTQLISSNTVFTLGAFVRHDQYNYYPSGNPFADLGPADLQRETVSQLRFLTNAGVAPSVSYVKGDQQHQGGCHLSSIRSSRKTTTSGSSIRRSTGLPRCGRQP